MEKQRIAIIGATGYTARELIRRLLNHPGAEIVLATSRQEDRSTVADVHPEFQGRIDLVLQPFSPEAVRNRDVTFAFSCLPHAASAAIVRELVAGGVRTVDFSADYRLDDAASFQRIYGVEHPDPDQVPDVPYGLPELFRDRIRSARLVANPGCFPTSAILPLAPLLRAGLIEPAWIIVDSKTGISGAGRTPKLPFHFPECNESVQAYGIGTHRHRPEMEQVIGRVASATPNIVFTPHLIPMDRGILSTIYVQPTTENSADTIRDCLQETYVDEPFVRLVAGTPATKQVAHTNFCDISVASSGQVVVLTCAIDNLVKGAAGAAVQNFNIMCGYPETAGLL